MPPKAAPSKPAVEEVKKEKIDSPPRSPREPPKVLGRPLKLAGIAKLPLPEVKSQNAVSDWVDEANLFKVCKNVCILVLSSSSRLGNFIRKAPHGSTCLPNSGPFLLMVSGRDFIG